MNSVSKKFSNRTFLTITLMMATIMQTLDSTIANVALPRMQGTLAGTQDEMTWVLTSYIVAAAIMTPLTGWLAGRYGRKQVFLISIVGFTLASALCGAAESLSEMILFRILQGICGAALIPLSQATLIDINSKENYARAMALWGIGVTMGPILGPALGGWLTDDYNWRWVFYINVPIGILTFFGLLLFSEATTKHEQKFDFMGFAFLSLAVGFLQVMLDRGELKDWFGSIEIIIYGIISAIGFYLFIIHTMSHKNPFIKPSLFKDRNFVTANIFIFIVGVVLYATLALLPPLLQNEMNYPVITTGLVTAPRGAGTMFSMFIVGRLVQYIDARVVVGTGFILTAFSLWLMTQYSLTMDEWPIINAGFIQGMGIGFAFVPLSAIAFSTMTPELHNEGTAFFNLVRNLGSSIGISVVQALLTHKAQMFHSRFVEHVLPYQKNSLALQNSHADITSIKGLDALNAMITNQAYMQAYINDFKFMMIITLAVIPLLFVLRGKQLETNKPVEIGE